MQAKYAMTKNQTVRQDNTRRLRDSSSRTLRLSRLSKELVSLLCLIIGCMTMSFTMVESALYDAAPARTLKKDTVAQLTKKGGAGVDLEPGVTRDGEMAKDKPKAKGEKSTGTRAKGETDAKNGKNGKLCTKGEDCSGSDKAKKDDKKYGSADLELDFAPSAPYSPSAPYNAPSSPLAPYSFSSPAEFAPFSPTEFAPSSPASPSSGASAPVAATESPTILVMDTNNRRKSPRKPASRPTRTAPPVSAPTPDQSAPSSPSAPYSDASPAEAAPFSPSSPTWSAEAAAPIAPTLSPSLMPTHGRRWGKYHQKVSHTTQPLPVSTYTPTGSPFELQTTPPVPIPTYAPTGSQSKIQSAPSPSSAQYPSSPEGTYSAPFSPSASSPAESAPSFPSWSAQAFAPISPTATPSILPTRANKWGKYRRTRTPSIPEVAPLPVPTLTPTGYQEMQSAPTSPSSMQFPSSPFAPQSAPSSVSALYPSAYPVASARLTPSSPPWSFDASAPTVLSVSPTLLTGHTRQRQSPQPASMPKAAQVFAPSGTVTPRTQNGSQLRRADPGKHALLVPIESTPHPTRNGSGHAANKPFTPSRQSASPVLNITLIALPTPSQLAQRASQTQPSFPVSQDASKAPTRVRNSSPYERSGHATRIPSTLSHTSSSGQTANPILNITLLSLPNPSQPAQSGSGHATSNPSTLSPTTPSSASPIFLNLTLISLPKPTIDGAPHQAPVVSVQPVPTVTPVASQVHPTVPVAVTVPGTTVPTGSAPAKPPSDQSGSSSPAGNGLTRTVETTPFIVKYIGHFNLTLAEKIIFETTEAKLAPYLMAEVGSVLSSFDLVLTFNEETGDQGPVPSNSRGRRQTQKTTVAIADVLATMQINQTDSSSVGFDSEVATNILKSFFEGRPLRELYHALIASGINVDSIVTQEDQLNTTASDSVTDSPPDGEDVGTNHNALIAGMLSGGFVLVTLLAALAQNKRRNKLTFRSGKGQNDVSSGDSFGCCKRGIACLTLCSPTRGTDGSFASMSASTLSFPNLRDPHDDDFDEDDDTRASITPVPHIRCQRHGGAQFKMVDGPDLVALTDIGPTSSLDDFSARTSQAVSPPKRRWLDDDEYDFDNQVYLIPIDL